MKFLSLALAVALAIASGCVYDPVNYEKVRQQEFQDHLKQNGGDE